MFLRNWLTDNEPDEGLSYKNEFYNQSRWVRDVLVSHLTKDNDHDIWVSNTHTSKSILLPVYYVTINGNSFEFRNNFHDWCVTGTTGLNTNIPAYLNAHRSTGFYEGMDTESAKFKFCVSSKERLYAIMLWIVHVGYK